MVLEIVPAVSDIIVGNGRGAPLLTVTNLKRSLESWLFDAPSVPNSLLERVAALNKRARSLTG